jgi:alcohol dehydrogenase (cytochrome c)
MHMLSYGKKAVSAVKDSASERVMKLCSFIGCSLCALMVAAGSLAASVAIAKAQDSIALKDTGRADYQNYCMNCHGENYRGAAFGPSLKSKAFRAKWNVKGAASLHDYIAQFMPPANPTSLSPEIYSQLTALILHVNNMASPDAAAPQGLTGKENATPAASPAASKAASKAKASDDIAESGGLAATEENRDAQYLAAIARRTGILAKLKPVTEEMLRHPPAADWLSWRRTDDGYGFSPLDQINRGNAHALTVAWSRVLPVGTNAITPLAHDGVIFLDSSGTVLAIDAASGDTLWSFVRPAAAPVMGPPVTQPRGMAIYEDRLYVPTSDNHMIALDIHTGKVVWDHLITGMQSSLRITAAPIVVRGKVIQGMSGCAGVGEPGGCFIVGLDARTGAEIWRFYTIARAGQKDGETWNGAPTEKRFGASVWSPGTYDAENNLVYFGTGQTYHIVTLMSPNPKTRYENSGLYTDTTLALNPDTGKLVWHYQHMARDVWDLDWAYERIITTLPIDGKPRKVVMNMGKLGILDALDAKTGKYLFSYDLGMQNLVTGIDPVTGAKTTNPAYEPDLKQSKFLCPFPSGVRNWPATSYNPVNHLLYVGASESCMNFSWLAGEGFDIIYGVKAPPGGDGNFGKLIAINLETRKIEWTEKHRAPESSAILSTAGGIAFDGGRDKIFRASDSISGKVLWNIQLDNTPSATPITFAKDGIQYVAITTGGGNPLDIIVQPLTPEIEPSRRGTTLWVFKLEDTGQALNSSTKMPSK